MVQGALCSPVQEPKLVRSQATSWCPGPRRGQAGPFPHVRVPVTPATLGSRLGPGSGGPARVSRKGHQPGKTSRAVGCFQVGPAPGMRSPRRTPGVAPAPRCAGPRPRRGAGAGARAGAEAAAGPGRTNFLLGCGRQEAAPAAPGPRGLRASPPPSFAPAGTEGRPGGRRAGAGRCGAAAAARSARPDRPLRGERARGAGGGRAPLGWRCAPGGQNRPGPAPLLPRREGGAAPGCRLPEPGPWRPRGAPGARGWGRRDPGLGAPEPPPDLATASAALALPLGKRAHRARVCGWRRG